VSLEDVVLTVPEAAAMLGVAAGTYYAAASRGEVPAVRIGRRLVVPGAALARLLQMNEGPGLATRGLPVTADATGGRDEPYTD
jgi:excisionase family DNA binding protein